MGLQAKLISMSFSQIVIPTGKGIRCQVKVKNTGDTDTDVWVWPGLGKIIEPWQNYQWTVELDFEPAGHNVKVGETATINVDYPYADDLHNNHAGVWDAVIDVDSVTQSGRARVNAGRYWLEYWSCLDYWWGYGQVEIQ